MCSAQDPTPAQKPTNSVLLAAGGVTAMGIGSLLARYIYNDSSRIENAIKKAVEEIRFDVTHAPKVFYDVNQGGSAALKYMISRLAVEHHLLGCVKDPVNEHLRTLRFWRLENAGFYSSVSLGKELKAEFELNNFSKEKLSTFLKADYIQGLSRQKKETIVNEIGFRFGVNYDTALQLYSELEVLFQIFRQKQNVDLIDPHLVKTLKEKSYKFWAWTDDFSGKLDQVQSEDSQYLCNEF